MIRKEEFNQVRAMAYAIQCMIEQCKEDTEKIDCVKALSDTLVDMVDMIDWRIKAVKYDKQ